MQLSTPKRGWDPKKRLCALKMRVTTPKGGGLDAKKSLDPQNEASDPKNTAFDPKMKVWALKM